LTGCRISLHDFAVERRITLTIGKTVLQTTNT
jgi:hypothetical protein